MQKLKKLKILSLWVTLVAFLLAAPLSSCGNKKVESDAESTEHPTDGDEHPTDSEEHPN